MGMGTHKSSIKDPSSAAPTAREMKVIKIIIGTMAITAMAFP
jgi:hypothetical protein